MTTSLPNMKYDFSKASRGRLRTYNLLVDELERMEEQTESVELSDADLELLSAAGSIKTQMFESAPGMKGLKTIGPVDIL